MLTDEADTAAYSGRLREAEELTRRAIEAAERAGEKEKAASFSTTSGVREAQFGNAEEARRRATLAAGHSAGVDVLYGSALALAFAGDRERPQHLVDELDKRFSSTTYQPAAQELL